MRVHVVGSSRAAELLQESFPAATLTSSPGLRRIDPSAYDVVLVSDQVVDVSAAEKRQAYEALVDFSRPLVMLSQPGSQRVGALFDPDGRVEALTAGTTIAHVAQVLELPFSGSGSAVLPPGELEWFQDIPRSAALLGYKQGYFAVRDADCGAGIAGHFAQAPVGLHAEAICEDGDHTHQPGAPWPGIGPRHAKQIPSGACLRGFNAWRSPFEMRVTPMFFDTLASGRTLLAGNQGSGYSLVSQFQDVVDVHPSATCQECSSPVTPGAFMCTSEVDGWSLLTSACSAHADDRWPLERVRESLERSGLPGACVASGAACSYPCRQRTA